MCKLIYSSCQSTCINSSHCHYHRFTDKEIGAQRNWPKITWQLCGGAWLKLQVVPNSALSLHHQAKVTQPMAINEIQFSWDILMPKSVKYNKNLKPCFQPFQNLRTWNDVWIPFVYNILNSVIITSVNDLMGIIPRIFLWNNPNWSIIYL